MGRLGFFIQLIKQFQPIIEEAWPLIKQLMEIFSRTPQPSFATSPGATENEINQFVTEAKAAGVNESEARAAAEKCLGV